MSTFDNYLLKKYLHTYCVLFISIFGLYIVIDCFTNIDAYQEGAEGFGDVLKSMGSYYIYQSLVFFDMIGSVLAVIAAMVVFAILYKNSEIHPLLAAGIPTYRLFAPVVVGVFLMTGLVIGNQEILIPRFSHQILQQRGVKDSKARPVEPTYDHTSRILVAGKELYIETQEMHAAAFVLPVPNVVDELTTLHADTATYHVRQADHPAGWLLKNVAPTFTDLHLAEQGGKYVRSTKNPNNLFVVTDVSLDQVFNRRSSYKWIPIPVLIERIRNPSSSQHTIGAQTSLLHTRLMQPLLNFFSVAIALPLIIRRESRSLVTNLAVCAVCLGIVFGVVQLFGWMGKTNILSAEFAAWGPIIIAGTLAAWLTGYVQS